MPAAAGFRSRAMAAAALVGREWHWLFLVVLAPAFFFPLQLPWVLAAGALIVLASGLPLLWGRGTATRFDWPLGVLVATACLGAWVAPLPQRALPKLSGIVFGLLVFRAVVVAGHTQARLYGALLIYAAVGALLVALGALTAAWGGNITALSVLAERLPRLVVALPGAADGVNANALGGTTLFVLPVWLVIALSAQLRSEMAAALGASRAAAARRVLGVGAACGTLLMLAVLVISQSRAAWLGAVAVVSVVALALWPARRTLVVLGTTAVIAVAAAAQWASPMPATLARRIELWRVGWHVVREVPLTGIGLGGFGEVARPLRPLPWSVDGEVGHAHNQLLQVALDTGVGGLVAYVAVVVSAALLLGAAVTRASGADAAIAAALAASLLGPQVFGLVDAFALGSKVGVLFWICLGLAAVLARLSPGRRRTVPTYHHVVAVAPAVPSVVQRSQ